jgi:hypothetical protein
VEDGQVVTFLDERAPVQETDGARHDTDVDPPLQSAEAPDGFGVQFRAEDHDVIRPDGAQETRQLVESVRGPNRTGIAHLEGGDDPDTGHAPQPARCLRVAESDVDQQHTLRSQGRHQVQADGPQDEDEQ